MSPHGTPFSLLAGLLAWLLASLLATADARASVIVRIVPDAMSLNVGETGAFEIRADLSQPVLGFGLDLDFDTVLLSLVGTPSVDTPWLPLSAPDGDALAGLASAGAIAGTDVLLATFVMEALSPGEAAIVAALTPGDLTEGFPLDPVGFDEEVLFEPATIAIVPEPTTGLLVGLGLLVLGGSRRKRGLRPVLAWRLSKQFDRSALRLTAALAKDAAARLSTSAESLAR